jgi:tetratricopeptide (TPR) repeat protein
VPAGTLADATADRGRTRTILAAAALAALVLAAYYPALSGGYVWDDDDLLTNNLNVRTLDGLVRTWADPEANEDYYPLVYTSWWIEYHLWGLAPFGFHLDNILLHAASAILLWLILRRLAVPGAWVVAAFFALHPVQVESVAWVAERKSVLGGLFCLLAVGSFLRYALAGEDVSRPRRRLYYALSLVFYVCGCLARPVTMAVAAVLPLVVWWKRRRLTAQDVLRVVPYLLVAAPMAALTIWVQYHHVGATGDTYDYSDLDRVLIAGRALWFYAGKLAWPQDLTFAYAKWAIDSSAWWPYLYPAGAVAVVAALALFGRRIGHGPLVAVLVFIVMLSPALGFINVYWHRYYFVADHMQYLPCIALIALGVAAAARGARRLGTWARPVAGGAAALLLGVCAFLTWQQCGIYKDAQTIWEDTLRKDPESWMAHNSLGTILFGQGHIEDAIWHYRETLRYHPNDPDGHHNLALALIGQGKTEEAIDHYREVLRFRPRSTEDLNSLGVALAKQGHRDEAVTWYLRAIQVKPDFVEARTNLALALAQGGQTAEAIEQYREALRLRPDLPKAHYNLAVLLVSQGQPGEAADHCLEAIRLRPDYAEAHNKLGTLLDAQGQTDEAISHYLEAIRVSPALAAVHNNLGLAHMKQGRPAEAAAAFREALRLSPGSEDFRKNLQAALDDQARRGP